MVLTRGRGRVRKQRGRGRGVRRAESRTTVVRSLEKPPLRSSVIQTVTQESILPDKTGLSASIVALGKTLLGQGVLAQTDCSYLHIVPSHVQNVKSDFLNLLRSCLSTNLINAGDLILIFQSTHVNKNLGSNVINVKGLSSKTIVEDIEVLFQKYGKLRRVFPILEEGGGMRSAFVQFEKPFDAKKAFSSAGGSILKGSKIEVYFANEADIKASKARDQNHENIENTKLFVKGLGSRIASDDLEVAFGAFGVIQRISSINKMKNSQTRYSIIDFRDHESARLAKESLNNRLLKGMMISVNWQIMGWACDFCGQDRNHVNRATCRRCNRPKGGNQTAANPSNQSMVHLLNKRFQGQYMQTYGVIHSVALERKGVPSQVIVSDEDLRRHKLEPGKALEFTLMLWEGCPRATNIRSYEILNAKSKKDEESVVLGNDLKLTSVQV